MYQFSASIWRSLGKGGWYFVSLPVNMSKEIRANFKDEEKAWGRLEAKVIIQNTTWETAIWFDSKQQTYLLPIKAVIRKKLNVDINAVLKIKLFIEST